MVGLACKCFVYSFLNCFCLCVDLHVDRYQTIVFTEGMQPIVGGYYEVHLLAIAVATHPNNYNTVTDHIMISGVLHWPSINCDECNSYMDIAGY